MGPVQGIAGLKGHDPVIGPPFKERPGLQGAQHVLAEIRIPGLFKGPDRAAQQVIPWVVIKNPGAGMIVARGAVDTGIVFRLIKGIDITNGQGSDNFPDFIRYRHGLPHP